MGRAGGRVRLSPFLYGRGLLSGGRLSFSRH